MASLLTNSPLLRPLENRDAIFSCSKSSEVTRLQLSSSHHPMYHPLLSRTVRADAVASTSRTTTFESPILCHRICNPHGYIPRAGVHRLSAERVVKAAIQSSPKRSFVWPSTATQSDESTPDKLLYILHLSTSRDAKSALSQPGAGIQVALIGESGRYALHRVDPHSSEIATSPSEVGGEAARAERAGSEAGASATRGSGSARAIGNNSPSLGRARFQRGSVDTVQFVGDDVGRIAALWIAPEAGTWRLSEARVMTFPVPVERPPGSEAQEGQADVGARAAEGQRYLFRSVDEPLLGEKGDCAAAEMLPTRIDSATPATQLRNAITGGADPDAVSRAREASMAEYADLKRSLVGTIALLSGLGSALAAYLGGSEAANSFAAGALAGLLYLLYLQYTVDSIPSPPPPPTPPPSPDSAPQTKPGKENKMGAWGGVSLSSSVSASSASASVSSSPLLTAPPGETSARWGARERVVSKALRVGVLVLAAVFVVQVLRKNEVEGIAPAQLFVGLLGFFTYKAAILVVTLWSLLVEGDR